MSNPNTVYVVFKNNSIHSIHSNPESADVAKGSVRGARVSTFPLIKSTADGKTGVTEAIDLDSILGGGGSSRREFTARDNDVPDQPYRQPSGEYEDEGGDDFMSDEDVLVVDIPLAIRLMEWAHEEAADDNEIHEIVDRMITLTADSDSVLTMDHFEDIVGELAGDDDLDADLDADLDTDLDADMDAELPPSDDDLGAADDDQAMSADDDEFADFDAGDLGDEEADDAPPAAGGMGYTRRDESASPFRRVYEGANIPLREYVEKLEMPNDDIPGVMKLFNKKTTKAPKGNVGQTYTVSVDPVTGAPKVDSELSK